MLVLVPSFVVMIVFFYGFILWTVLISFTNSRMLPHFNFVGLTQYITLFTQQPRWLIAMRNLLVFGGLFIGASIILGLFLAILLDQRIRGERLLQTLYLYPMALSFIVTGTIWKWILNPSLGIERLVQQLGFSDFTFRWLVDPKMAIYTIVIAAAWQSTGYIMSLFLAGLRSIDSSIPEAAQVDGASLPRIYWSILIPMLRPVFMSSVVILTHLAIKAFDLVVVLTQGGPGISTDMPATFMYDFSFKYDRLALGAASSVVMLVMVMIIIVPYLISELRGTRNAQN
ncbi:MAG TPA: sugar ABC transporter permease [Sediminispirochaeta sp.]|nr:sugar ABC transporter permease [Sediminispirochaeta sp.]